MFCRKQRVLTKIKTLVGELNKNNIKPLPVDVFFLVKSYSCLQSLV